MFGANADAVCAICADAADWCQWEWEIGVGGVRWDLVHWLK